MRRIAVEDRAPGAAVLALLAVALLVGAYVGPWFEYDFSTGRKTPPGGPQPEDLTMEETAHLDVYADRWEGDIEPADEALAKRAITLIEMGIYTLAGAMLLVAAGELPGVRRIIRRPVSLGLSALGLAGTLTVLTLAWHWLPGSMAAYGVDAPYMAHLVEPDGYTRATLAWGYYAMALSIPATVAAFLVKFQAGVADPQYVERLTAHEDGA